MSNEHRHTLVKDEADMWKCSVCEKRFIELGDYRNTVDKLHDEIYETRGKEYHWMEKTAARNEDVAAAQAECERLKAALEDLRSVGYTVLDNNAQGRPLKLDDLAQAVYAATVLLDKEDK